MASFIDRYRDRMAGELSCYDRVVIQGILQSLCYAKGMEACLRAHNIRFFDFSKFVKPLRDQIQTHAAELAKANGIKIQYLRNHEERKEDIVSKILERRGQAPGLVAILSTLEKCRTYEARYDKSTGRSYLINDWSKCLHYYFYFIDEDLGLCFLRVATWCPFGLKFYFNGHNLLASKLRKAGIEFTMIDNAFATIADWDKAQTLADELETQWLQQKLNSYVHTYCPAVETLEIPYYWTLAQVEYSTDLVFRKQSYLCPIYDALVRTAAHAVKADDIATFLGKQLRSTNSEQIGNNFHVRIQGSRIKHSMGPVSIKMYDKAGLILRIETTTNDPSWFSHYRTVAHRDGTSSFANAHLKKSIFSLHDLRQLAAAANRRYLAFLSDLDDPICAFEALDDVTAKVQDHDRGYAGFNFFSKDDVRLFEVVLRGENTLSGMRNGDLRTHLPDKTPGQVSRLLKRMWLHGLIKKVAHSYKYYISDLGRKLMVMGLKLKELHLIPELARALAT